jgi:hypothetical protein
VRVPSARFWRAVWERAGSWINQMTARNAYSEVREIN